MTGVATCPSCSAEIPAGSRFCPSCGASLEPRSDERRVVTVLFGDMVGFTPLSEVRDPEHVKNLLDRCFERLSADIAAHGGRVDKIVGDEIMAVFGAPLAHEDDPERAVRAALQMQRTLEEHAPGDDLRMRIGVNTGEVLVGSPYGVTDVTALGDVVNVASRLQVEAKPGEVLVGPATHEATKEVFSYEEAGALEVKGRSASVVAHRAVAALGPPGFRPDRARTPMIGRKDELGLLWHALSHAAAERRPHLVLLVGEAGAGKSILAEQVVEIAHGQYHALVMEGRCLPYGEANPWWPVAEALRQACGIEAEDPAEVAAAKCRDSVASVLDTSDEGVEAARVSDGLLYLMGYGGKLADVDPSRARDEAARSIQVSLAANARQRPVVIVLSELHWADELVLDLVDSMLDRLRDLPLVLVATARPELLERWSPKPGRYNLFVVNVGPLGREESVELTRSLLGADASSEVVDLIVERSAGNPLFISELAAMLGTASTAAPVDLANAELPATLRGLVAARLDSIEARARSLLADAAVVGRSGPVKAVTSLATGRGEEDVNACLDALVAEELLVLDDGRFEFRSELVRDVAYETLTKGERARRHAAVGGWLDDHARATGREEEYLERVAHHYAVTAQLVAELGTVDGVPSDVRERALDWLDQAAVRAEARDTTAASVHLLEQALGLLEASDERRGRFLLGRALAHAAQRDMPAAYADVGEALGNATALDDDRLRARALTVRGEIEQKEGDLARSSETLQTAVELWRALGERQGEAEALRLWGYTSIHRGMLDAAEDAISRALAISRELGDRRGEAWALQNLAWAAFSVGDNDLAEERLNASANLFQEIGDFGGHGWAMGLLGYVWYFKGRLEDAGVIAEGGVQWSREMGDRWAYGMMLNLLATVRLWQGRTTEALERASEANLLFEEIDDAMGRGISSVTLGWALLYSGRATEASELADRHITRPLKMPDAGPGYGITAAAVWGTTGQETRALELLEEIEGLMGDNSFLWSGKGLTLALLGRFHEAYEASRKAWKHEDDPGPKANAACIHAMVAAFAGHGEEAIRAGDEVGRTGGTYVDQLRAHVGRALGYSLLGRRTESETAFGSARRIADASEDVLHQSLVRLAEGTVRGGDRGAEVVSEAKRRLAGMGVDPQAWERAFQRATSEEDAETVRV